MPNLPALQAVPQGTLLNEKELETSSAYDALAVIAPATSLREPSFVSGLLGERLGSAIETAVRVDSALGRGARRPVVIPVPGAPGGRVILAPMGTLTDDTEDVRAVAEATSAAASRAVDAGARRLLVSVTVPPRPKLGKALDVAAIAALGSQWYPLEAREAGSAPAGLETIGVVGLPSEGVERASALEIGRSLCRDITGTEPERMAPLAVAALCEEAFAGTGVKVEVDRDPQGYPLLMAVARASMAVPRHRPCVVRLDFVPDGGFERTVVLVGKGVTYDTGGADLKTDGAMAGMSRDKGGAGAVAGLLRAAAALKIPGVRVIGLLGLVRNSIGEESFVTDEIIRSRAGVRVRIGNTDAEGRLVLADLLAAAGEITASDPTASLLSIATLTGHVYRAYGPYIGAIGNAPSHESGLLDALDTAGELWGEPIERSRVRREDYAFIAARSSAEDVVSSNRQATVSTPRGHQFPFAFIDVASGLRRGPRPLVHMDISGAALDPPDWQFGRPTGSPVATLAAYLGEKNS